MGGARYRIEPAVRSQWCAAIGGLALLATNTAMVAVLVAHRPPCWTTANEVATIKHLAAAAGPGLVPLQRAHAHNDYSVAQTPLLEALSLGFCSVEADVLLRNNTLFLGHHTPMNITLEGAYLRPLAERVAANNGTVFVRSRQLGLCQKITLLIDLTHVGHACRAPAWTALTRLLNSPPYNAMVGCGPMPRSRSAVDVVISGVPKEEAAAFVTHMAANGPGACTRLDADGVVPNDPGTRAVTAWVSMKWGHPSDDATIAAKVDAIHAAGYKARYWGGPDNPETWQRLLNANVDIIGTDKKAALYTFLRFA